MNTHKIQNVKLSSINYIRETKSTESCTLYTIKIKRDTSDLQTISNIRSSIALHEGMSILLLDVSTVLLCSLLTDTHFKIVFNF